LQKGNNSYFTLFGLSFVLTDAIDALKNNDILSYAKVTAAIQQFITTLGLIRSMKHTPKPDCSHLINNGST